jgi:hypothetical protein
MRATYLVKEIPEFILGKQYIELPNKHLAKYRFQFNQYETRVELKKHTKVYASFFDAKRREWLRIEDNILIVFHEYAWNGCSPKRCVFGKWIGTPDTRNNTLASGIHDALCQFINTVDFPFTKEEVDLIFYEILLMSGFLMAHQYYWAVKKYGCYDKRNGEYSELIDGDNIIFWRSVENTA